MTSILKVDTIQDTAGNNIINESSDTITIGASGDTVNIVGTLQNNGSALASYTNSDALTLFNATGSTPVYACRAWVNFNGTGVVAIREDGNVTSITDNGTGTYTVNFTTAMQDSNYNVVTGCSSNNGYNNDGMGFGANIAMNTTTPIQYNTTGVRISCGVGNGVPSDGGTNFVNVAIFR